MSWTGKDYGAVASGLGSIMGAGVAWGNVAQQGNIANLQLEDADNNKEFMIAQLNAQEKRKAANRKYARGDIKRSEVEAAATTGGTNAYTASDYTLRGKDTDGNEYGRGAGKYL